MTLEALKSIKAISNPYKNVTLIAIQQATAPMFPIISVFKLLSSLIF
jgi:hypothetical protein